MARRLIIDGGESRQQRGCLHFRYRDDASRQWLGKEATKELPRSVKARVRGHRIGATRFNFLFPRFLLAGLTSRERRESRYVCQKEIATELVETRLFLSFFLSFLFAVK